MRPAVFVIFGITGDLSRRYLLPALYHLFKDGLLHEQTKILGLTRRDIQPDQLLKDVEVCVLETDKVCDPVVLEKFRRNLELLRFDPTDESGYGGLKDRLEQIDAGSQQPAERLFYLAIPPTVYGTVVRHLGLSGLDRPKSRSRLLVEKPFGYDLTSAKELINTTAEYFDEPQIYRIDHYLAKGTAQNILTFRRDNPLFSAVWNGQHIKNVEVMAAESLGMEGRGGFYNDIGALRDLVQSHLLQLLALTTLELPKNYDEASLHAAKKLLLDSLMPPAAKDMRQLALRAQYDGYLTEINEPASATETFASINLRIKNDNWPSTPVRLTSGKQLAAKQTYVRLFFDGQDGASANVLTFRLQPNEGIDVTLRVRKPGFDEQTEAAVLDFDYQAAAHPSAYERVLIDAAKGDRTLFASSDEVLASWRVLQPIIDYWQTSEQLAKYQPGSTPEDVIKQLSANWKIIKPLMM